LFAGVVSNYNTQDVDINSNHFEYLNSGVVLSKSTMPGNEVGPIRYNVVGNLFENIANEGFFVGSNTSQKSTNHISSLNTYTLVGNNMLDDTNPIAAVINFQTSGNRSITDRFSRTIGTIINGSTSFAQQVTSSSDLLAGSNLLLIELPYNQTGQTTSVYYNLIKSTESVIRNGELKITVNTLMATPEVNISDRFNYTGPNDGLTVFSVEYTVNNTIKIFYTNTGGSGNITYSYTQLQ